MKKRLLLFLLVLLLPCSTFAYDFAVDGIYYDRNTSTQEASVTYRSNSYASYSGIVNIPEEVTYNGVTYSVTSIGEWAFHDCSGLTSITIPNSVTSIGYSAFYRCSGLTSVTIPKSVTSIDSRAFYDCSSLKEITISDGESMLSIEDNAFSNSSVRTLYLGRNINPASSAFKDDRNLRNLTIGNCVTEIGDNVFSGCSGYKITSYATTPPTLMGALDAVSLETPLQTTCLYARSENWKEIECIYAVEDSLKFYPVLINQEGNEIATLNNVQGDIEVAEYGIVEIKPMSSIENGYLIACGRKDVTNVVVNSGHYTFTPSMQYQENIVETVAYPQINIAVTSSGTLLDDIGIENIDNVYSLKVSGDLNGTDILAIRKMTNLRLLDMGDANIVNGGLSYYQDYITSENEIGAYFFHGKTNLSKIILPKTITSIGQNAFENMTDLVSIPIPSSVTKISYNAFKGCSSLESFVMEDGTKNLSISSFSYPIKYLYMGRNVDISFKRIESLKYLTIGDSVTSIRNEAFYECSGLTEVTIGNSVTSIGSYAFDGCSSLTEVTIGNSVTSIGSYAFSGCSSLAEVTIGSNVSSIGSHAFWVCSSLTNITIPNSVISIGSSAFEACRNLTEVTIGSKVSSIGTYAFSGCSSLTDMTISDGDVGMFTYESSFYCPIERLYLGRNISFMHSDIDSPLRNKTSLKSLTVGNCVSSIQSATFSGCSSLAEVHISDLTAWCNISFENGTSNPLAFAHHLYLGDCEVTKVEIPTTTVKNYTFYGCDGLTEVTIGDNVTSIGSSAFEGCRNLTEVTIGNNVTSIGSSAFEDCRGLTSVTIGNSVTSIGSSAFRDCSGLTSVIIPNSVTSIASYAFGVCSGLTSVIIPNSVTSIGSGAFEYCSGLTSITIPNSVTSIGNYAFEYCRGLTSVTIGNSVTSIGIEAFYGCSGLTEVTIGSNVSSIGSYAFARTSLVSVTSLNTTPPKITASTFDETTEQNATLHVTEGCKTIYWLHPYWENFYNIQADVETGIENVKADGQMQQSETNAIYTIKGVRLNTTNLSDLPKGIYIVNGKKISIK